LKSLIKNSISKSVNSKITALMRDSGQ